MIERIQIARLLSAIDGVGSKYRGGHASAKAVQKCREAISSEIAFIEMMAVTERNDRRRSMAFKLLLAAEKVQRKDAADALKIARRLL